MAWDIKVVVGVDSAARKNCTKQLVRNVKRNAKFLLSPAAIARFIARIAFQSVRIATANSYVLQYLSTLCDLFGCRGFFLP